MTILLYMLLIIFVALLAKNELKTYGTILTPFCLIAIPMTVILGWLFVVVQFYDFPEVSIQLILTFFLFYFVFWLPSLFARFFIKKEKTPKLSHYHDDPENLRSLKKVDRVMTVVVLLSSLWLVAYFVINARGVSTLGNVVQTEFQDKYTGGFNFYPRILCLAGTAYFIGTINRRQLYKVLLIGAAILPIALSLVKGIIFLPVISGLILYVLINKVKIKVSRLILIPLCGIVIFFGAYMVEWGVWNISNIFTSDFYRTIFAKFNYYLISGTESFNINLVNGANFNEGVLNSPAFAPFFNLFSKVGGADRINTIGSVFTKLGYIEGYGTVQVNTNGFFGILVLYSGYGVAVIYSLLFSLASYALFVRSLNRRNILYKLIYALIGSGLFLGWFDFYFMQTFWYYLWAIFELAGLYFEHRLYSKKPHKPVPLPWKPQKQRLVH